MRQVNFTQLYNTGVFGAFIGWDGTPVERDPHRYKYSYDPYFLYRADTFNPDTMSGEYSDRMWEWDHDKFDRCVNAVWPDSRHGQSFYHDDPKDITKFLELYFGYPVVLHGILQGCNVSSGYPYWIFVFTKVEIQ